jgi:hypothetical protein
MSNPMSILGPDPDTFIPEYVRMSHILGRIAQDEKIRYLDTVPFWYHALTLFAFLCVSLYGSDKTIEILHSAILLN